MSQFDFSEKPRSNDVQLVVVTTEQLSTLIRQSLREELSAHAGSTEPRAPTGPGTEQFLTVDETSAILHVTRQTLNSMEKRGELIPARMGRRVLYRRSDIDRAIAASATR